MQRTVQVFMLLFLISVTLLAGNNPAKKDKLPAGVSTDWWGTVQENIRKSEYTISRAKSELPGTDTALQAPNRKQNFRTWFVENGFVIEPRTEKESEPVWTFGLELIGYGAKNHMKTVTASEPEAGKNRVSWHDDRISQWCENREDGLEHGFTVHYPVDGDKLEVRMAITGNLRPSLANETTVELVNEHGVRVLTYNKLMVKDADGKKLPAVFKLENNRLSIITDTRNAVFPIEIDPLASTSAWTAESDQADARFGYPVSSAGDVNGDGYGDVIVGAPYYDNGQSNEGRAFVYLGSASGLSTTAA
ncbi:MAG: hypothetical protein GXO70_10865, partial [Acidobacteria bacterium]|nr:hypothetical protein [Acidobacteriota bacterium]